jgi:hypothetical protein
MNLLEIERRDIITLFSLFIYYLKAIKLVNQEELKVNFHSQINTSR